MYKTTNQSIGISQSIGKGGRNTCSADIKTVQGLLNAIPVPERGIPPYADVDVNGLEHGSMSIANNWNNTVQAILTFQKFHGCIVDGRVDPARYGGTTIIKLNQVAAVAAMIPATLQPVTLNATTPTGEYLLVQDMRVLGRPPPGLAQHVLEVPAREVLRRGDDDIKLESTMTTEHVIDQVAAYARSRAKLDNLYILCHGFDGHVEDPYARKSGYNHGWGLALGKDPGWTLANVRLAFKLQGLVSLITLFACGPAYTSRGYRHTNGDGRLFCGQMAINSGADVIAATGNQAYRHGTGGTAPIDLGNFEGSVYLFSHIDGTGRKIVGTLPSIIDYSPSAPAGF